MSLKGLVKVEQASPDTCFEHVQMHTLCTEIGVDVPLTAICPADALLLRFLLNKSRKNDVCYKKQSSCLAPSQVPAGLTFPKSEPKH